MSERTLSGTRRIRSKPTGPPTSWTTTGVNASGVNASSIYAEFDSKQALYREAIARYDEIVVTGHFGALEQESALLDEVAAVLRFFGEAPTTQDAAIGCLLCNAATDELSRFLTVLLMGMFVLLRAAGDPALLRAAAEQGLARLESVTLP